MGYSILFPSLALALGVIVSAYMLVDWLRHGRRPWFLLYWALALFLMYWFQVPIILNRLGRVIVQTDFNLFFAITFPITFIALILVYYGALDATGTRLRPRVKWLFLSWVLAAVIFFVQQFIVQGGEIQQYTLPLVGIFVFYLPIRLLIIATLARWLWRARNKTIYGVIGAWAIIGESIIGLYRNFLVLKNVLAYPPEFWYIILSGLDIFFILQTASIILLVVGFHLFHYRQFHDHLVPRSKKAY